MIEVSGGFYVTEPSLKQYGFDDNLIAWKYRKVQKANKANSLLPLTHWSRIHVAKG